MCTTTMSSIQRIQIWLAMTMKNMTKIFTVTTGKKIYLNLATTKLLNMFVFFPAFSLTIKKLMLFQSLSNSFSTHCEYSSVDVIVSLHHIFSICQLHGIFNFLTAIYSFHGNMHTFLFNLYLPRKNPESRFINLF